MAVTDSPFPGMDPYLEQPAFWRDFHFEFLANLRAGLNDVLPTSYSARLDEHIRLVEQDPPTSQDVIADVAVVRGAGAIRASVGTAATLKPIVLQIPDAIEVREHWIEVRRGSEVVTIIEMLSPSNKAREREVYNAKRAVILRQQVNLVEIDLLIEGRRLPMRQRLPAGHYYVLVAKTDRRPDTDVYAWSVRDPLPTVPCPLLPQDGGVPMDLAAAFRETYRRAAYGRQVRYAAPVSLPLSDEDLAWATETARVGTAA